jgi:hypothetical protein
LLSGVTIIIIKATRINGTAVFALELLGYKVTDHMRETMTRAEGYDKCTKLYGEGKIRVS